MQTKEKIPILAVVGPTASGKTALGVELAKAYNGEVVSADSMQIYKAWTLQPQSQHRKKCRAFRTT